MEKGVITSPPVNMSAIRDPIADKRACDCGCGRQFICPSSAPHKRFATEACRMKWHRQRWRQAAKLLSDFETSAEVEGAPDDTGT